MPPEQRDSVRERLTDLAYGAGWAAVRAVPAGVAAAGFRLGADLGLRRNGPGVRRLAANLRRVLPDATETELTAVTRTAYRRYARFWLETFRLPAMDPVAVLEGVRVEGEEHLKEAAASGRGVLVAAPHMGNYDACAVWMAGNGYPFTTVAERLRPESLFDRFLAYRRGLGMEVLATERGERPPSGVLRERLQGGGIVVLICDRELGAGGVPVTFFGAPTRLPGGPAFLCALTGAVLVPAATWFEHDGWVLRFDAPIEIPPTGRLRDRVSLATQTLADGFAARIAAHPADWHMLQPMWPTEEP